ncbi:cyclase/dehydrase, partial [Micromonospora sp. ATCC 39149]
MAHCGLDAEAAAREPAASLEDLGMDSLALLELSAVVADRYRVRLPEDAARLSIAEVADLVTRETDPARSHREQHRHRRAVAAGLGADQRRANWPNLFTEYASAQILERDG